MIFINLIMFKHKRKKRRNFNEIQRILHSNNFIKFITIIIILMNLITITTATTTTTATIIEQNINTKNNTTSIMNNISADYDHNNHYKNNLTVLSNLPISPTSISTLISSTSPSTLTSSSSSIFLSIGERHTESIATTTISTKNDDSKKFDSKNNNKNNDDNEFKMKQISNDSHKKLSSSSSSSNSKRKRKMKRKLNLLKSSNNNNKYEHDQNRNNSNYYMTTTRQQQKHQHRHHKNNNNSNKNSRHPYQQHSNSHQNYYRNHHKLYPKFIENQRIIKDNNDYINYNNISSTINNNSSYTSTTSSYNRRKDNVNLLNMKRDRYDFRFNNNKNNNNNSNSSSISGNNGISRFNSGNRGNSNSNRSSNRGSNIFRISDNEMMNTNNKNNNNNNYNIDNKYSPKISYNTNKQKFINIHQNNNGNNTIKTATSKSILQNQYQVVTNKYATNNQTTTMKLLSTSSVAAVTLRTHSKSITQSTSVTNHYINSSIGMQYTIAKQFQQQQQQQQLQHHHHHSQNQQNQQYQYQQQRHNQQQQQQQQQQQSQHQQQQQDQRLLIRENQDIIIYRKFQTSQIPCPPISSHHITVRPRYYECHCNPTGSVGQVCDRHTGQCVCHVNVTGRRCESCILGTWNMTFGIGCMSCQCDSIGSLDERQCNQWTGQCNCKDGVGGNRCNECLEGFYGFSSHGCKRCDTCESEGYVCDPDTGRCICPQNSKGIDCRQCLPGTWGWQPKFGCQKCDCDLTGSIGQSCDTQTGQCICREGYYGRRCDSCASGYFDYPECKRCDCNVDGSISISNNGSFECDFSGQCKCKEHVTGLKCDTCRQGTFGLSKYNRDGCTRCFCFGRTQNCEQSNLSWGLIRMPGARNLSVQYIHPTRIPSSDYEYVVVIQMEGSRSYREDAEIKTMNGLNLIPSSTGNVSIGAYTIFYYPLYFQLPPQFYGDKTTSYGGYIKFNLLTEPCNTPLDKKILQQFPMAQIHSHNKLVLDYYEKNPSEISLNESYSIPLHESYWKFHHNRQDINRAVMMAALQNIKHIFLRGTSWADFTQVVLHNVQMDAAIYLSGSTNSIAQGIEKCHCSKIYDGLSCQDPGKGYYRWRNQSIIDSLFLEDLIGRVIPCDCNDRSDECDRETGLCINCQDNTGGSFCERCAEGYYGDPNFGGCKPCPCPETNRNFAKGCTVWMNQVSCICKPGYTGPLCEKCRPGYFGYPDDPSGKCEPCNCNLDGIISEDCDRETGQCRCLPGVTGRTCDTCLANRHVLEDRNCKLCDNCTIILMDYVELISNEMRRDLMHLDLSHIPAPWKKLQEYENERDKLLDHLQDYLNAKSRLKQFDDSIIEKLNSHSENTKFQWRRLEGLAHKRNIASGILLSDLKNYEIESGQLYDEVNKEISKLRNYVVEKRPIDLPMALKEAQYYLRELKDNEISMKNMEERLQCAWDNHKFFEKAFDVVQDQQAVLEMFWRNFKKINSRIMDGMQLVEKIFETLNATNDILEHIKNYKNVLNENQEEIIEIHDDIRKLMNNSLIAGTEVTLEMIQNQRDEFGTVLENIKELREILNNTIYEDLDKRRNLKKHWIPIANRHAEILMKRSSEYAKKFQPTKDAAKIALLASSAHKNITDAIDAAREAVKEAKLAAIKSQELLRSNNGESIIDQAKISFEKSQQIRENAIKEMQRTDNLNKDLKIYEDAVESIKSTIWKAGSKNNEITSAIISINNKNHMELVNDTINLLMNVSLQTQNEIKKVENIRSDFPLLRQKFANLEPDWDTKLGLAEENISQTLSHIREANNSLNTKEIQLELSNDKFHLWNDTVSKQIQELKDKITKAKHAADSIKISLGSHKTKCIRSYMPKSYGLSTSNTINLSFALNNKNGNSPLIFIQGRDKRFIALELVKRRVRLIWNLGGDTGVIVHPLEIQGKDPKYDDAWYHIEANRTLNIGSLLVRRMTNIGTLNDEQPVTGTTNSEHTRFFTSTSDRIWLGGIPNGIIADELLKDPGLNVVIHQIIVDNRAVGLWNFIQSEGQCEGAMIGAEESSAASNARHFNGLGYAKVHKSRPRPYRKNLFYLQMTFKTFDENALLFLAVDDKNNRSVSVTLSDGCIIFRIDYGDEAKLEINTTEKFNTGNWVNIEAAREFVPKRGTENGRLKVNTRATLSGSPTTPIKSHMLPDLFASEYYLGGVPPGFKSGSTKAPGADNRFMGCMMDVQINGETYDPLQSSSYFGVEQSCRDTITKAGFFGKGYMELPSQSLRKKSNIGFVFRTLQPECLLLLSAYPPEVNDDYDSKDLRGNYSVSLIEGHVVVWIHTGRTNARLFSNVTTNDGEFHVINIIKLGRKIELWVDDELQMTENIRGIPTVVNMPKDVGGLYFGGSPDYQSYKLISPTYIGLEGAIKDIVLNNKTISLNEVKSFKNVQIGRDGPPMGSINGGGYDIFLKTEPIGKSFAATGEGCQRVGSYSYEPNAFKFGDGPNSHSQIQIPIRHFWQKNFIIKFDFRTFYSNGIILIASGTKEKQKHFIALILKDGNLMLIVRGRRKEELNLTARLNDGQWHHIMIKCMERKLTMSVEIGTTDQKTSAQMKIPKKIGASNTIFIGGLPSDNDLILPTELLMRLETFKGCIRDMTINNSTQDLARPGKHFNVGQCFPKVEKGSFFPGDAYAIYKKNFHVGKYLELEIEFRTSELNGILLSVSEPIGFPALSLELHNGNIIFSCDFGDGNPFRVESIFPSKYTVCDNKWHNISALYNYEQLTIRIDNQPAIMNSAQQKIIGKIHTKSALYIGGIPDTAPGGSLLSRENFKGCIKNVSIRNEKRDWTDMDGLHNVLLSECLFIN